MSINESSALTVYKPLKGSAYMFKFLCVWETYLKIYSNEKSHQHRFFFKVAFKIYCIFYYFLFNYPLCALCSYLDMMLRFVTCGFISCLGNHLIFILTHIWSCFRVEKCPWEKERVKEKKWSSLFCFLSLLIP